MRLPATLLHFLGLLSRSSLQYSLHLLARSKDFCPSSIQAPGAVNDKIVVFTPSCSMMDSEAAGDHFGVGHPLGSPTNIGQLKEHSNRTSDTTSSTFNSCKPSQPGPYKYNISMYTLSIKVGDEMVVCRFYRYAALDAFLP